jgi:AraC family ethanolamine operon transcriptional activator
MKHFDAQNKGESLSIKISNDAHEHAHNLRDWHQHYDQISSGEFYGKIIERSLEDLQIFQEHTSQSLSQDCLVREDSLWLGIAPNHPLSFQGSKINGLGLNTHDIMCRPGGIEFELSTPNNFDIYGVVVTQEKLLSHAEKQGAEIHWQEILQNERLAIPTDTLNGINYLLARLLEPKQSNTNLTPDYLTQDLILMGLLDVLNKETPNQKYHSSYRHRKNIVNLAREYLHQHSSRAITLSELSEACHTSTRTLQNSFESILGLSPIQYLRYTRLNGVRRDLKVSAGKHSVGDVAARWGFWHLSQFAKDYKGVFGELPSDTLQARLSFKD